MASAVLLPEQLVHNTPNSNTQTGYSGVHCVRDVYTRTKLRSYTFPLQHWSTVLSGGWAYYVAVRWLNGKMRPATITHTRGISLSNYHCRYTHPHPPTHPHTQPCKRHTGITCLLGGATRKATTNAGCSPAVGEQMAS